MIVIHSLYSLPLLNDRWGLQHQFEKSFFLYYLSFLYAKRLGYEVVLHTDDIGYELLKNIGYDRIELSLNDLKPEDATFWSLGKIRALELEGLNSIHIDGDVFLKSNQIKTLFESDYDVLTQMIESQDAFNHDYVPQIGLLNSVSNVLTSNIKHSYNCGVLAFKDTQLFIEYANLFRELVAIYKNDLKIKDFYKNEFRYYEKMLIIEQYSLPVLTNKLNKNPKFIINENEDLIETCNHYGFVHALGSSKYEASFQALVKQRIKELR
ncbi:DUF6734 family protein [Dokdonia pacifica]|uniref:DUF6734 domain-containing protein n=1 Tax=Dokdonia pacifica TaxID=1627892 RepID=A0A238WHR7_9FLAO|nr:DUF6734 family protein [Dokdonia pacifica]SNR45794.1 hypothetical protein SAMN06265376_1011067 [Dokdonia pacifica]